MRTGRSARAERVACAQHAQGHSGSFSCSRSSASPPAAATTRQDRNTYADQVNRARTTSRRAYEPVAPDHARRRLRRAADGRCQGFEDAVDTVVTDLRRIDAPSDLAPLHQQLIAEIAGYGKAIHKAKVEFATGSPQRSEAAQSALVDATTEISTRINRTIAAINRQLQAKK